MGRSLDQWARARPAHRAPALRQGRNGLGVVPCLLRSPVRSKRRSPPALRGRSTRGCRARGTCYAQLTSATSVEFNVAPSEQAVKRMSVPGKATAGRARRTWRAGRRCRARWSSGRAGRALDELVGRELAAVAVEASSLSQPCSVPNSPCAISCGISGWAVERGGVELRAQGCCRWCSPGTRRRRCRHTSARPAGSRRGRRAGRCRSPP